MNKIQILFLLLLNSTISAFSQIEYQKKVSDPIFYGPMISAKLTCDSSYILLGTTNDKKEFYNTSVYGNSEKQNILTIKISKHGEILSKNRLDGYEQRLIECMIKTINNEFVILSTKHFFDSNIMQKRSYMRLTKIDSVKNKVIWDTLLNFNYEDLFGRDMLYGDSLGNIYIIYPNQKDNDRNKYNFKMLKLDKNGKKISDIVILPDYSYSDFDYTIIPDESNRNRFILRVIHESDTSESKPKNTYCVDMFYGNYFYQELFYFNNNGIVLRKGTINNSGSISRKFTFNKHNKDIAFICEKTVDNIKSVATDDRTKNSENTYLVIYDSNFVKKYENKIDVKGFSYHRLLCAKENGYLMVYNKDEEDRYSIYIKRLNEFGIIEWEKEYNNEKYFNDEIEVIEENTSYTIFYTTGNDEPYKWGRKIIMFKIDKNGNYIKID